MSGPALFFSLADVSVNPSNGLDSRGIVERPCLGTPGFWHFEEHGIRTLLEVRVVPQGQGGVVAYNFKLICGKESVILDARRAYSEAPSPRPLFDGQDLVDAAPREDDPVTVSRIADSHVLALLSVVMEMLLPEPNGDVPGTSTDKTANTLNRSNLSSIQPGATAHCPSNSSASSSGMSHQERFSPSSLSLTISFPSLACPAEKDAAFPRGSVLDDREEPDQPLVIGPKGLEATRGQVDRPRYPKCSRLQLFCDYISLSLACESPMSRAIAWRRPFRRPGSGSRSLLPVARSVLFTTTCAWGTCPSLSSW